MDRCIWHILLDAGDKAYNEAHAMETRHAAKKVRQVNVTETRYAAVFVHLKRTPRRTRCGAFITNVKSRHEQAAQSINQCLRSLQVCMRCPQNR